MEQKKLFYGELPRLSCITSIYFNNGGANHLYSLLSRYNDFPDAIMKYIQFVIVDDCSSDSYIIPSYINLNIKLLKITEDIPWNNAGAKNLGVTFAPSAKILLTDIDHYIPSELLTLLLEFPVPYCQIYDFEREEETGEKIVPHKNTFFTSKSIFFKSLGYDEQYCGNYGHDDSFFFLLQLYLGTRVMHFESPYPIKRLGYYKTHHSLTRDTTINKKLLETHKEHLQSGKDPLLCHSRLFLNFKWEIVEERFYKPSVV